MYWEALSFLKNIFCLLVCYHGNIPTIALPNMQVIFITLGNVHKFVLMNKIILKILLLLLHLHNRRWILLVVMTASVEVVLLKIQNMFTIFVENSFFFLKFYIKLKVVEFKKWHNQISIISLKWVISSVFGM